MAISYIVCGGKQCFETGGAPFASSELKKPLIKTDMLHQEVIETRVTFVSPLKDSKWTSERDSRFVMHCKGA